MAGEMIAAGLLAGRLNLDPGSWLAWIVAGLIPGAIAGGGSALFCRLLDGGLPGAPLDQQRSQCREGEEHDRQYEGPLHRVDVAVDEHIVSDHGELLRHRRWDVARQARSGLAGADLKSLRPAGAECGDELIAE